MSTPRDEEAPANGRIITFYSYKGGTGRSMALANVAWILASSGLRVLVIDWDLEAPGLHRYFRPFLTDPELSNTPGLIDFFLHFGEAARIEARRDAPPPSDEAPWYVERADLLRYSLSVEHDFPGDGVLDFVGAGQQGPSYSVRVNSFHWNEFYEKLGGGAFLGCVKQQLRQHYDYVLIDSRTGLSDTSGICTVQMPDELVVCFTLNRQSILGAASTALSAHAQRRLPNGQPGLRIWPVPTRVDTSEKDRLDAARALARAEFAPLLWHVPAPVRGDYWGRSEILYFPYYAYEEVLATIADRPRQGVSLLHAMERLTGAITRNAVTAMPTWRTGERERLLQSFLPAAPSPSPRQERFFLSYASADHTRSLVAELGARLELRFGAAAVLWDAKVPFGSKIREWLDRALGEADTVIVVIGPQWGSQSHSFLEVGRALEQNKRVIPLLVNGAGFDHLPPSLRDVRALSIERDAFHILDALVSELVGGAAASAPLEIDVDDPHRGQFGGQPIRSGRQLEAAVKPAEAGWFSISVWVKSASEAPLTGEVTFHLHPTFLQPIVTVPVHDGCATLELVAWGAFTVGAVADGGLTRLELNLAELPGAPTEFTSR